jgi:hypothetical protein
LKKENKSKKKSIFLTFELSLFSKKRESSKHEKEKKENLKHYFFLVFSKAFLEPDPGRLLYFL